MSAPNPGTLAELNAEANAGARIPKAYSFGIPLAVATHTVRFKPRAAGTLRFMSTSATFPNTATINLMKNGSSVLVGGTAKSLTTNVTLRLEGFGTDITGPDQNFNTNTDANRALLNYEVGDELSFVLIIGTGAATAGGIVIDCDERQPERPL